ncbi:nucleotidyltransferase family protein [Sporolituus thermophilus]|uniref:MobA-like NTP transferase domain-containing protein n=1 Tax=Sporolituus thermophilus DSM 23256 TaxID=1123285 RepID=A0A1G7HKG1_9FIRM|nr:nucleotidyltransferase family protein [Sporolituus thermophilus]SDF00841.1 MobA-like NTP transferase domain-containing protein [Sporolituus thermophilus DSM 23256]
MYDAIILAGGQNAEPLRQVSAQPYEAMIDIAGKPMVTFVAEALAACPQVGRIFVVGPARELANCGLPPSAVVVEGGRTIVETISRGMAALGHERKVLVVTADIPLVTPEAIQDFLAQCSRVEADLYYPIVRREDNERYYPGNKRTYVRFREGTYTGGNIFLVNPAIVPRCMAVAERIIENRKNPFKLCCLLGWSFVFKFIFGRLMLPEVEKRVAAMLGITGAVIESRYPELGIDVDKPSDLEMVRSLVQG